MRIESTGLEAFLQVIQSGSISSAAIKIGLTQSALSQRILNLEDKLEVSLFERSKKGLKLTANGHRFLKYAQTQKLIEEELLGDLKGLQNELVGTLRIAAYSSILSSVIIPSLAPWLKKNPKIRCEFRSYETVELEKVLSQGRADIVFCDSEIHRHQIVSTKLGYEDYRVIAPLKNETFEDVYLDHDEQDIITDLFFKTQKLKLKYQKAYFGDTHGILTGVEEGLGRAVLPRHLISAKCKVRILDHLGSMKREVFLHYVEAPYYPKVLLEALNIIQKELPKRLR